jgi:hypothetical protein
LAEAYYQLVDKRPSFPDRDNGHAEYVGGP